MSFLHKAVGLYATSLACLAVATLQAQDYVPSPTVVRAQSGTGSSPYVASTLPLGNVPEGVTIYYWPEDSAARPPEKPAAKSVAKLAPNTTKVAYASAGSSAGEIAPRALEPKMLEPANFAPSLRPAPLGPVSQAPSWQPTSSSATTSYPTTGYPTTTLRPLPATTVQYATPSGGQCICTPAGTAPTLAPQTTFAPSPGGYVLSPNGYGQGNPGAYPYSVAMPVSQLPPNVYFGHGLIGQPKVYVQGQPVRNTLRYLSP